MQHRCPAKPLYICQGIFRFVITRVKEQHKLCSCKYCTRSCSDMVQFNFTSFHCTGRYELNKLTSLPMCGFIAQLVEHRTGIAEVTGSNPVEAPIFFRLLLSNCLNWKLYCDDHSSLSSTTIYNRSTNMNYFI